MTWASASPGAKLRIIALSVAWARSSVVTVRGVERQRRLARETADIGGAVGTREDFRRVHVAIPGLAVDEQGVRRSVGAAAHDHAVALQAIHHGQRQPLAGEQRPWSHRDHDGIRCDRRAVDQDACDPLALAHEAGDLARVEAGAAVDRRVHHRAREPFGMHLRGGAWRAELLLEPGVGRQPARQAVGPYGQRAARARRDRERVEAAIAPVAAEFLGEFGVQSEAAPGEWCQRRAVAPVEGEKAAGLAGGRAGDAGTFDEHGLDLPLAEEVGDAGADHAAAADHDTHRGRLASTAFTIAKNLRLYRRARHPCMESHYRLASKLHKIERTC